MTGSDDFLSRWSRRKQEAAKQAAEPAQDESETGPTAHGDNATGAQPAGQSIPDNSRPEPSFDLSKLPSLESIGPRTDVSMFMQPGVPTALSRAALRRAWAADPAIRDFIGLSENAWDFTAPDSMPGFGPLLPTDDVKRLLAQVFREEKPEHPEQTQERPDDAQANAGYAEPVQEHVQQSDEPAQLAASDEECCEIGGTTPDNETILSRRNNDTAATQQKADEKVPEAIVSHRRHGGALPT